MLTVVRPAPAGQGEGSPAPRRRRSSALGLTETERKRLRAALKNLRLAYGTWSCLAEVMGVPSKTLKKIANGQINGSPGMALRTARAAGIPFERLIGGIISADRCPSCGRGSA